MLIRAVPAAEQSQRIWETRVLSLNGEYQMNDHQAVEKQRLAP